ncbi:MAG: hypothetical protein PHD48_08750 [Alphaproteobacteria bacterium]|nr:hypothetical protein [Alphaproteobacteria bacterium]
MTEPLQTHPTVDPSTRMQTLLASFRQIGMPLLQVLVEGSGTAAQSADEEPSDKSQQFGELVDSAICLSIEMAKEISVNETELEPAVRWALSGAASQVVAAGFRATGKALTPEEAARLAALAGQLQEKFKSQIPVGGETIPNTVATFRAKMMEAMVPVIGAVAQYSFGRGEHELLAEVCERLVKMSDQVTRSVAEPGSTPEQWRLLCWNILRAAGQIYAESHYAEADRILYMGADDRAAYLAQHGTAIPMTQIWQAFNQRMAMLATLAMYLDVPASAQLEKQGW